MSDLLLHPVQRDLVLQGLEFTFRELIFPVLGQIAHRGADPDKEVNGSLTGLLAKILNHVPLLPEGERATVVFPQHLEEGC